MTQPLSFDLYKNCTLCPRKCGADRLSGKAGICGESSSLFLARAALHMWEEPCISGTCGSGAVFFSGCPLHCIYCQNYNIANGTHGKEVTPERLSDIFLELKVSGAGNINLVTPTHYIPHIIEGVASARDRGLDIPIVYNTSGYERTESLDLLKDTVDIYLTDCRYYDPETAKAYSKAPDYPKIIGGVLDKMFDMTGSPVFNENNGMMKKGIIVRVLVLPGHHKEAQDIIKFLYERFGDNIYISLLRQYTPILSQIPEGDVYKPLKRSLTSYEYDSVVNFALDLGVTRAYVQEKGVNKESFIPAFDYTGV